MSEDAIRQQLYLLGKKLEEVETNVRGSVHQYEKHLDSLKSQAEERVRQQAGEIADLKCQLALYETLVKELISVHKAGDKSGLEEAVTKLSSMLP